MRKQSAADRAEFERELSRKLDPEALRTTLMWTSVVLIAHELTKAEILRGVRGFYFVEDIDALLDGAVAKEGLSGDLADRDRYRAEVRCLHPTSEFLACCEWLRRSGALAPEDIALVAELREHRHELAHNAAQVIDPGSDVKLDLVWRAADVVRKVGRFWARIDIDCSPHLDGIEIPDEEITPGTSALLDYVLAVASGLASDGSVSV